LKKRLRAVCVLVLIVFMRKYTSCGKSILHFLVKNLGDFRALSYTTNIIEGLNRQFRRITKNKPSFTNDDSLRKMLYLESTKIVEHWTARCRNWDQVISQLNILFSDRAAGQFAQCVGFPAGGKGIHGCGRAYLRRLPGERQTRANPHL